jgi:hypothetical protein
LEAGEALAADDGSVGARGKVEKYLFAGEDAHGVRVTRFMGR